MKTPPSDVHQSLDSGRTWTTSSNTGQKLVWQTSKPAPRTLCLCKAHNQDRWKSRSLQGTWTKALCRHHRHCCAQQNCTEMSGTWYTSDSGMSREGWRGLLWAGCQWYNQRNDRSFMCHHHHTSLPRDHFTVHDPIYWKRNKIQWSVWLSHHSLQRGRHPGLLCRFDPSSARRHLLSMDL